MAVENVGVMQQLTQKGAQSTSSNGVLQTGILALMMIMMFTMDGRYQSLIGMIGNFFAVIKRALPELSATFLCAMLTLYVCSFELEPTADKTQQLVRDFWPTMKDPDTLLAIHGMMRFLILVSVWVRAHQTENWPVPASYLHFTAVSLLAHIYLYNDDAFALEGPFAGPFINVLMLAAFLQTLACAWKHKVQTGERVYPLAMISVLLVSAYVAQNNRLTIATEDSLNTLFSFAHFVDLASMLHCAIFCCCAVANGEMVNSQADGLMFVMIFDRLATVYYILDGFGMLPSSTLESIGAVTPKAAEFQSTGHPMLLLSVAQVACLACAMVACVAYFLGRFWNDDKAGPVPQAPQVRARVVEARAHAAPTQQSAVSVPTGKLSTIVF
jgi:hypothetical protein